jgi:hypothetical protein
LRDIRDVGFKSADQIRSPPKLGIEKTAMIRACRDRLRAHRKTKAQRR